MKNSALLIFLFLFCHIYGQEKETINLKKEKTDLFRGVEEDIQNWYLFVEGNFCYLANLTISESEVKSWFETKKGSQNIFKGELIFQQYSTVILMKDNEPDVKLKFYIEIQDKTHLKLTNMDDTKVYTFVKK
jgi:hypothetical protein